MFFETTSQPEKEGRKVKEMEEYLRRASDHGGVAKLEKNMRLKFL